MIYQKFDEKFINEWNKLIISYFKFPITKNFIIKKIFFQKYYISAPILPYTCDIDEKHSYKKFLIKKIIQTKNKFKSYDTVTYRILTKNQNKDELKKKFNQSCRRHIKKAYEEKYLFYLDEKKIFINDLYKILIINSKKHGSPFMPFGLFEKICNHNCVSLRFVKKNQQIIGGRLIINNNGIYLVQYAHILDSQKDKHANYFFYWSCLSESVKNNNLIFDFGRSPYNSKFHDFKIKFRPNVIKLDYLSNFFKFNYKSFKLKILSYFLKKLPFLFYKIFNSFFYRYFLF